MATQDPIRVDAPTGTSSTTDTTTGTSSTTGTTTTSSTTTTAAATTSSTLTGDKEEEEEEQTGGDEEEEEEEEQTGGDEEEGEEEESIFTSSSREEASVVSSSPVCLPAGDDEESRPRTAPPSSLSLTRPTKKKILVAPALSLSLGPSESEDFPPAFLSPSADDDDDDDDEDDDEDDTGLDFDLDAMETPSDSESLPFPLYDLEEDMRRLGAASRRHRAFGPSPRSGSGSGPGPGPGPGPGLGPGPGPGLGLGPGPGPGPGPGLDQEDVVDSRGVRWRRFSGGDEDSSVNMSVLEPFLRVLAHGGYYGDGMNDIIVFSSCYLPQNNLENYQYVMDNLFRYVVGTLDLMVSDSYVMVYLCAGGHTDRLPPISWMRECYTTIHRRLRKNLKCFFVVHPTWYVKALVTLIKPFISSKFSRKLQFVDSLQDLSLFVPTEHVQIPECVSQYDRALTR